MDEPKIKERVNIIASGYEWTCPGCETNNTEISHAAIVRCEKCEKAYFTDNPDHSRIIF